MIKEIASIELPVHENLSIRKTHLAPFVDGGEHKRLSLVTGIHGDELDGQYIVYEVIRRVQEHPEYLAGEVDLYPAINPLGVDMAIRAIPMFDLDMNRIFPGSEKGVMAEYFAAALTGDLYGSDLVIDIHSSNIYVQELPQIRVNEQFEERVMEYARGMNTDIVWVYSSANALEATLAYTMNTLGVPAIVAEMGVGHRINRAECNQMLTGIFHVMQTMGIWTGPVEEVRTSLVTREGEVSVIRCENSGVFVSHRSGLGAVSQGELIGEIILPMEGRVIQEVRAPHDGFVFTLREHPVVYAGDLIARIHGGMYE
ncbi:MAG: succinylglutamate desuccinylase/aspartoacylase family protein [Lachnospiraceae bacterium]|nr:succinylglutamate desuccinylase/aspartoacylase family protein [Lachnospiraceae bacterium]